MVRDFQSVIGEETRGQILAKEGRLPDGIVACVGAGSNAIGMFHAFVDEPAVRMVGVEAAGVGLDSGKHGASLARGAGGILHGSFSYVLQDEDGQIQEAHSIAAGLDYPSVGPEHAFLKDSGRVEYTSRHRRRGAGRLPGAVPAGGHHPGPGERARHRLPAADGAHHGFAAGGRGGGQPLRPGRQRRLQRGRHAWG